jgi:hypothetical protein
MFKCKLPVPATPIQKIAFTAGGVAGGIVVTKAITYGFNKSGATNAISKIDDKYDLPIKCGILGALCWSMKYNLSSLKVSGSGCDYAFKSAYGKVILPLTIGYLLTSIADDLISK